MTESPDVGSPAAGPKPRSRRRWVLPTILGAVVLVAAVAGGLVVIRRPGPSQPPEGRSAPLPVIRSVADGPAGLAMVYVAPSIAFADARHGFILLKLCPTTGPREPRDACPAWVASTEDGGVSWHAHQVPGTTFPRNDTNFGNPDNDIVALDATHVAFVLDDHNNYRFSADAGSQWTTVSRVPTADVAAIPANAYPLLVRGRTGGSDVGVLTLDGTMARLSSAPLSSGDFRRTSDGSLWLSGATLNDRRFKAYTSRDGGRTWTPVPMPDDAAMNDPSANLLTGDGHTLFAVPGTDRVWRSSDLGQHWQRLPLPFRTTGFVATTVLMDGALVALDESNVGRVLAPTGSEFTPLLPTNGYLGFRAFGARYLGFDTSVVDGHLKFGDSAAHSADGISWTEIPYHAAAV